MAAAWELCTKEDVGNIHPVNVSELEDSWSITVEALIRQHLGTPYLGSTNSVTAEVHNGDGAPYLRVKKPPISSVTAIRINEVQVLPADFIVFTNHIQLESSVFPRGNANVQIDYVSGSTDINPVIKLTASSMIVAVINYKKRYGADASIKWSNPETKSGEDSPNKDLGLAEHLTAIMKQLLRRPVARVRM